MARVERIGEDTAVRGKSIALLALGLVPGYGQTPQPGRSVLTYPVATRTVAPEYTPEARAAGIQGSVILCLTLDGFGRLEAVHIVQSLGFGLEEKAIDAVRRWQFKPALLDGKPVRVKESVEVPFALSANPSWRLMRLGYQVTRPPHEAIREVDNPVLTGYARADDVPCRAGGGAAVVELKITKKGLPGGARIIEERGEGAGKAVSDASGQWRFQPGRLNGTPRDSTATFAMQCGPPEARGGEAGENSASFVVGLGVLPPVLLYKLEPSYSEAARRAKFQGAVSLSLQVNRDGRATRMCIVQMLGMGLDEKAMEAINQWRFRPGTKDGEPVAVTSTIEVFFKLL